jgi:hypothetical protein
MTFSAKEEMELYLQKQQIQRRRSELPTYFYRLYQFLRVAVILRLSIGGVRRFKRTGRLGANVAIYLCRSVLWNERTPVEAG